MRGNFSLEWLPILFGSFRGSAPIPRGTFPSPEKYPKGRIREGPFRWGPSLISLLRDDTKGARVGTSFASLILPQAAGFGRCAAPPSSSANAALVCLGAPPAGPYFTDSRWINPVRRWKRLPGLTGLGENPKRGPQPPHWSLRGVVLRRGTQSKVSPSYACFCHLFPRGKSWSGCGAESPIKRGPGAKPPKRRECLSPRFQEHTTARPPGRQTPPVPAALPGWSPPSRTRR